MSSAAGSAPADTPQPGDVLVGKYRVERVLGVGGMGVVVSATHLQLEEKVAIKLLYGAGAHDTDIVARFLREGKAVIKIRSEHAVKVHDVGKLENGAPYLVMEHLDGSDLSTVIGERGAVSLADAVDYVLQACEAIAEAHALGIVHRDLKPANLFLTQRADGSPCVKVLDFGISKAATGTDSDVRMTRTQTVMGSPSYMSPEQMRSTRGVDARTDIWSLGVILYELVSGQLPFGGRSMTELCAQILQDSPPPLPAPASAVDRIVQRCLEKNPDLRYPTLAELATALAPFGGASARASAERIVRVVHARLGPNASGPRPALGSGPDMSSAALAPPSPAVRTDPTAVNAAGQSLVSSEPMTIKKSSAPLVVAVATVVVLGLLGAVGFMTLRGKSTSPAAPAAMAPAAPPPPAPAAPASALPVTLAPVDPPSPPATASAATPPPSATPTAASPRSSPPSAPPTRRAPPAQPPADGLFDGRK